MGAAVVPPLQNEFAYLYAKCQFTVTICCNLLDSVVCMQDREGNFLLFRGLKLVVEVAGIMSGLDCHT